MIKMNIYQVVLKEKIRKDLKKIPQHILVKLYEWIEAVSHEGLLKIRKIPGFHDEPLKGDRKGQRSIRLSKSYRAIYILAMDGSVEVAEIIEVNKHDY